MRHHASTTLAWTAAVIAVVVALLSLAPFVAAIVLTGVLVPVLAYTAWGGARLPSAIGLVACAAAFVGSPLDRAAMLDLLLAMAAFAAMGAVAVALWWALKPRRT